MRKAIIEVEEISIKILSVSSSPTESGGRKILIYMYNPNKVLFKMFQAVTSDMEGYNKALEKHNYQDTHIEIYKLIESQIIEEVKEWINS